MVLWEGKARNETAPLAALDTDAAGNSLEIKLHAYKDGRDAPTLHVPVEPRDAPPTLRAAAPAQDDGYLRGGIEVGGMN